MNNYSIQLIQSPIIKHSLEEMGKSVSERLSDLNLEKQVATEETLKTLKDIRADLNKESQNFEEQRKTIKNLILTPYNDFETIYKSEILEKYKDADKILKDKINDFEMSLKIQKKENLIKYFSELCEMEQIDWITFDRLSIDVNLSTTEKKYKELILEKTKKIVDDILLITSESYSAEMLVEYKKSLNASSAIQMVRKRKSDEKIEAERLKMQSVSRRTSMLRSLGFIFHDLTKTYNWANDESIMISYSDIETLSDDEWIKRYTKIETITVRQKVNTPSVLKAPTLSSPIQEPSPQSKQELEETFVAKFTVTGTYKELEELSMFLKSNNYNYQNID